MPRMRLFDCLPYARALAEGSAAVNLCAPGGVEVMHDLARLLAQAPLPPAHTQPAALAWMNRPPASAATACIRACPLTNTKSI